MCHYFWQNEEFQCYVIFLMSHLIIIFKHACHYRGLWVHWILARALGKQANQTVKPTAGKVKATKMIIRCNKNLLNSKESVKELWRIKSNVSFPKRLSQKCCANKVFYAVISCALHWKKIPVCFLWRPKSDIWSWKSCGAHCNPCSKDHE